MILFCGISEGLSSQLALGVRIKQIYIWRYWEYESDSLHEKIAILNEDSILSVLHYRIVKVVDNGLTIHAIRDSLLDSLSGTWMIKPKSYICVDAPVFKLSYGKYLLSIYKDDKSGTLLETSTPKPVFAEDHSKIITTQGINGSGGNFLPNIWWEHKVLYLKSGQHSSVLLKIKPLPTEQQTVQIIDWPDSLLNGRQSFIHLGTNAGLLKADSALFVRTHFNKKSVSVSAQSLKFTIPATNENVQVDSLYSIEFSIKAPQVSQPTLVLLSVFYTYYKSNGGTFDLPYIVIP